MLTGEGSTHFHNKYEVEKEGAHADNTEAVNVPEEGEGKCHQQRQHQQQNCTQDTWGLQGIENDDPV